MKLLEIKELEVNKEIDWNKSQWVIDGDETMVVQTSGKHNGYHFEGSCPPCEKHTEGSISCFWDKGSFKRLTYDIPFIISND